MARGMLGSLLDVGSTEIKNCMHWEEFVFRWYPNQAILDLSPWNFFATGPSFCKTRLWSWSLFSQTWEKLGRWNLPNPWQVWILFPFHSLGGVSSFSRPSGTQTSKHTLLVVVVFPVWDLKSQVLFHHGPSFSGDSHTLYFILEVNWVLEK